MSVRKRNWQSKGETKTAWVVDYCDQQGAAAPQDLRAKRNADAFHGKATVDVSRRHPHRRPREPHRRAAGKL